MTILERQMIEVDGATLEIFVGGDRGPVICEAHPYGGYTGQLAEWDRRAAAARLVQVNGRGAGRSSRGRDARDYSFGRFVDDLEAVRRELGGDAWILMSDSAGLYASVHYALRYPYALRGLITGFLGPNLTNTCWRGCRDRGRPPGRATARAGCTSAQHLDLV